MRLVAFGCSLTFGHWLPDNADGNTFNPSKLSWPNILGQKLGISVVNKGITGASNKVILQKILDFKFKKNDQVFILWTHLERYTVFEKNYNILAIQPYKKEKMNIAYYKHIYNEFDHGIDFYTRSNHAHLLLESLGLVHYHLTSRTISMPKPSWNKVKFLRTILEKDVRQNYEHKDFALDNQHPGVRSHEYFANLIYNEIKA